MTERRKKMESQCLNLGLIAWVIIEVALKKGIETEDSLIILAKKCCLTLKEVKIWVRHPQKKKGAKGVQKAKETRAREKQNDFYGNSYVL